KYGPLQYLPDWHLLYPLHGRQTSWTSSFDDILGTGIAHSLMPLMILWVVFVVVSVTTAWIHIPDMRGMGDASSISWKTILSAMAALIVAVPLVQVFINSGINGAGYDPMPIVLANGAAALFGDSWPLISPTIGAIGFAWVNGIGF